KIAWGRFRSSFPANKEKKISNPVKTTSITFVNRSNLNVWKNITAFDETSAQGSLSLKTLSVLSILQQQGASFFDDIVYKAKLFPSQVEDALGELISSGLVTSDSYTGLRALLVPDKYRTNASSGRNIEVFSMNYAGRWSLLHNGNIENGQGTSAKD